jgi:2-iminoacetate synthase
MTFYDLKQKYNKFCFEQYVSNVSDKMIVDSMHKEILDDMDFLNLISPRATNHIEKMAQKAHEISIKHFGRNIILYTPLYVSNFCINNCVYCSFSVTNKIKRKILTFKEIKENCKVLLNYGIRHVLLVAGENRMKTSLNYLKECVSVLRDYFDSINIEIYPLDEDGYKDLAKVGVDGLTIYQETYDEKLYKLLHTKGTKSDYKYRLGSCERAGEVNYRNLNIGTLLGLNDFISEVFFVGIHATYLQANFPGAEIGISFPRLRPSIGHYKSRVVISDKNLVQAICAVRIFINRINITISTRENKNLRNNLIPLGITKMSAGSSTKVGGYTDGDQTKGQFKVSDMTTVAEVKKMIYKRGYQPVLKDWLIS